VAVAYFHSETYFTKTSNYGISFGGTNLNLMVEWLSQALSYLKGLSDMSCMLLWSVIFHILLSQLKLSGILFYQLFIISSCHYGYVKMEAVVF